MTHQVIVLPRQITSFLSYLFVGLLFFSISACQDTVPSAETPATTPAPQATPPPATGKMQAYLSQMRTLMVDEDGAEPSCTAYRVVDGNSVSVNVPAELSRLLACPSFITTSVLGNILIIDDEDGLQQYHFGEERFEHLMDLSKGSDGTSHVRWSPNSQKLAFIEVSQDLFTEKTVLHVLAFANGKFVDHTSHSIKANFSCASICSPAEKDFGFIDNESIYYRTYDKAPYDIKGDENKMTLVLSAKG